ncbi:MAG: hypothetical protein IT167_13015 [Bryobacterales bacterium]|nr:hypothetical protein [Bryobacterales bacterium]
MNEHVQERLKKEEHEFEESMRRTARRQWLAMFVLGGAVAAALAYGYHVLTAQSSSIAALPGLQQSVSSMSDRLSKAESGVKEWASGLAGLRDRMTKMEGTVDSRLRRASLEADAAADKAARKVKVEMDRRAIDMEGKLARLASRDDRDQTKLASLEQELQGVKRELAAQRARSGENGSAIAAMREDARHYQESSGQRLAAVRNEVESGSRELEGMKRDLAVKRIDFEVTKNHPRELVPGISVSVTGTNVSYRRVKGYVWLMPDRKTIWLKDQQAMEPVVFYSKVDGKRRELVFTGVTRDGATGYVVIPAATGSSMMTAGVLGVRGTE